MSIYLDNAATTHLHAKVFNAMTPYLLNHYGNPSSHHAQGRQARQAIEQCRATIAGLPDEIVFTSGGTEADNTAVLTAVHGYGIKHVITTRFEHHAVLHTLSVLQRKGLIKISFIKHDTKGNLDLEHLEQLLQSNPRSLVSVMHTNNEIGNLNAYALIGEICEQYDALFHTDTVQTIGYYRHDLQKLKVHFLATSAHKFHGPKGVGFTFCRKGIHLSQLIHGGGQESRFRAGTENIHGIVGLTKALEIASERLNEHQQHIQGLKNYMIARFTAEVPDVTLNGNSTSASQSLYTVLNVGLPALNNGHNLLRCLDDAEIAVSGASACSTGSASHVLQAIAAADDKVHIRFSFSKFNTHYEIDSALEALHQIYHTLAA
jgi:cysteine desulfurase